MSDPRPTHDPEDEMCECGDPASMHVDGEDQCFNGDCGCRCFEPRDEVQPDDARDDALSDAEGRN